MVSSHLLLCLTSGLLQKTLLRVVTFTWWNINNYIRVLHLFKSRCMPTWGTRHFSKMRGDKLNRTYVSKHQAMKSSMLRGSEDSWIFNLRSKFSFTRRLSSSTGKQPLYQLPFKTVQNMNKVPMLLPRIEPQCAGHSTVWAVMVVFILRLCITYCNVTVKHKS
jgi:hypothetical protein